MDVRDDLPNGSIAAILSRGFRFSNRTYYAQVVVAKSKEQWEKERAMGIAGDVISREPEVV